MPGEFGALLEEALGRAPEEPARPPSVATAPEEAGREDLDSSMVVAVTARSTAVADREPVPDPVAAYVLPLPDLPSPVLPSRVDPDPEVADITPAAAGITALAEAPETATETLAPRPTTIDGRVEVDPDWLDRPLLQQPVVLKPGASVGPSAGGSYIANCGSIPVTFVPAGDASDPSTGTFFVDPADVVAAAGPGGRLTDELMAQLSGQPYKSGPPTAIQMAIIDAARQAGMRFTSVA